MCVCVQRHLLARDYGDLIYPHFNSKFLANCFTCHKMMCAKRDQFSTLFRECQERRILISYYFLVHHDDDHRWSRYYEKIKTLGTREIIFGSLGDFFIRITCSNRELN
jgi:hypothetical protein